MSKLNTLRYDPTRTSPLSNRFARILDGQWRGLVEALRALVVDEDVFGLKPPASGLVSNKRWAFRTNSEKVDEFIEWLRNYLNLSIVSATAEEVWRAYVLDGYNRGQGRAFDDVRRARIGLAEEGTLPLLPGLSPKEQFLRSSFGNPIAVEKVKLLVSRTFAELEGVTAAMASAMTRTLADGLVTGDSANGIARRLSAAAGVSRDRAELISRTEIIRAHAEGQLDAFERLGVTEVGAAVEWATARDGRVCKLCEPLLGIVLTPSEARGLLPRHPRCRCAWIPNIGEKGPGIKSTAPSIRAALRVSARRSGDEWNKGIRISRKRPDTELLNSEATMNSLDRLLGDRLAEVRVPDPGPLPAPYPIPPAPQPGYSLNEVMPPAGECTESHLGALATLGGFLLNANPQGCNQYTGPNCAGTGGATRQIPGVNAPLPTNYGGITTGSFYRSSYDNQVREVVAVETNGQSMTLRFRDHPPFTTTTDAPFTGSDPNNPDNPTYRSRHGRPSAQGSAAAQRATSSSADSVVPVPSNARPNQPLPRSPRPNEPASAPGTPTGSTSQLNTAEGLISHLKASGAKFTQLDLEKIAALNPNGIVNGRFNSATLATGAANRAQLEKLARVLPPGTVIKGRFVTRSIVTPEAVAAVAGARAVAISGVAGAVSVAGPRTFYASDPPAFPNTDVIASENRLKSAANVLNIPENDPRSAAMKGLLAAAGNGVDDGDTTVSIAYGDTISLNSSANGYSATRTISRDSQGVLNCHNDYFKVEKTGIGPNAPNRNPRVPPGADLLANQVKALRELGVEYIDTFAAGSPSTARLQGGFVGFKVWPKLGYERDISSFISSMPAALQNHMNGRTNIQSLYEIPEGIEWWENNGSGGDMKFDMREGSTSMRRLEKYINERNARGGSRRVATGRQPARTN